MADTGGIDGALRDTILKAPESLLEDREVMRALVGANERAMGDNVVDMRGLAMDRLEGRLERLEDTHQSVIAAAYENIAGMHAVHRAVLGLLEADDFGAFLDCLAGPAADALRVDAVRLMVETRSEPPEGLSSRLPALGFAEPGTVDAYIAHRGGRADRVVTLRDVAKGEAGAYDDAAITSEALIRLDLGPGRLPALLLFGSIDALHFRQGQATDLLSFLGGVVERTMRRWLQ